MQETTTWLHTTKYQQKHKIDHATSNQWLTNKYLTSHFEAYACAIREQEIGTKDLIFRRERKQGKQPTNNNKCWLCKDQVEDITQVISSCGKLSSRYYLPLRHETVAKFIYEKVRMKNNEDSHIQYERDEFIAKDDDHEYWWNVSIKAPAKVCHNNPDLLIWNLPEKHCNVIEISCPADVNVTKKTQEKEENYGPLMRMLQLMCPDYTFTFMPVIIGALGMIPKDLATNIKKLGFTENEAKQIVQRTQQKSIIGTVKICKTSLNFKA